MTRKASPVEVAGEDEDLVAISNSLTRCLPRKTTEQAFVCPTVLYGHESFTFGSSSAPHICSVVTNAICDELSRRGIYCQCFIDDCVLFAYEDEIHEAVETLKSLIKEFGLMENAAKFVTPVKLLNTWLVNIAGGQQQAVVHYYRRLVARDLVYGDVLSCSFDIGVLLY